MLDLMYLGLKHFRMPQETCVFVPTVVSDGELGTMHVPTLLLIGEGEAIYDPAAALDRARGLSLISAANWCRGPITTCA